MSLVLGPRREHDETVTKFQNFEYFETRPGARLLEKLTNGQVRYWDFLKIIIGMRPGRGRESLCLQTQNRDKTESQR
jgi:hypothetical protein